MAGLLWPIKGHHTTQRFAGNHKFEPELFMVSDGRRPRRARSRKFQGAQRFEHLHGAIDIGCPIGTKVFAPEAGKIVRARRYPTGENYVMLQIKPGTILFFTHLDSFRVREGRHVKRGQVIALSGNTGKKTTGPHLHWEVRITTRANPDPGRSGRWFKWNPRRLKVGGDLAGLLAIVPPGAQPEDPPDPADPEPPEITTDPIDEAPAPMGEPEDPLDPPEDLGAPVDPVAIDTDPDPDEPPLDEDPEDTVGDAADPELTAAAPGMAS